MAPQVSLGVSVGKTSTVEHGSTVALFTKVNSFFLKNFKKTVFHWFCFLFFFEKPVQLSDFTRIIHVNVNNIFEFF